MGNKYTWVIFNMISSVGLMVFVLASIPPFEKIGGSGSWLVLLALGGSGYWIYHSIIYWRKCIEIDDPNFKKAVDELHED